MKTFNLQAATLPLSLNDGKWHHVCVTWTTRDGQWEAYQDGVKRGSGMNLSPWRSIKPGGVFILGQEQVKQLFKNSITSAPEKRWKEKPPSKSKTWNSSHPCVSPPCRTLWEAVLMPLSHTWARCQTWTCGPASWAPVTSTAWPPAAATSEETSSPGPRQRWSCTAVLPDTRLIFATEGPHPEEKGNKTLRDIKRLKKQQRFERIWVDAFL